MKPGFDYACSNLFCSEEVLEGSWDVDDSFGQEEEECTEHLRPCPLPDEYGDGDLGHIHEDYLDIDDALSVLFEKELHHMPEQDYLQRLQAKTHDAGARADAVGWLLKVQAHYSFGSLTLALSVNYLDRFLSRNPMPAGEKAWMLQLVSVACLSLAAKIEETEVPLLLDLQVQGATHIFEPRTIQRMELVVLGTLQWRLSSVTPFSYVDFFLEKLAVQEFLRRTVAFRIHELIVSSLQDIRFLEYRPSVVAASATLYAVEESFPDSNVVSKKGLLPAFPALKSSLATCLRLMEQCFPRRRNARSKRSSGAFLGSSVPPSPSAVLDASFGCDSESAIRSLESRHDEGSYLVPSLIATKRQRRGDELSSDIQLPF